MASNKINDKTLFLVYLLIMFVITFLQQEFVLLPELQSLDIVSEDTRANLLQRYQQIRWISFLLGPILLLLRLSLIALCLFVGGFFFNEIVGHNYSYGGWWRIALKAQSVMIVYSILLCVFGFVLTKDTIVSINAYSSLLFLADENIEPWVRLPLSAVNLFEILYWIVMALLVGKLCGTKFGKSFKFVMSTYGVGYLFYIALLMFLMLYLT